MDDDLESSLSKHYQGVAEEDSDFKDDFKDDGSSEHLVDDYHQSEHKDDHEPAIFADSGDDEIREIAEKLFGLVSVVDENGDCVPKESIDWNEFRNIFNQVRRAGKAEQVAKFKGHRNMMALSYVAIEDAPQDVFQAVLEAFPAAAKEKDMDGDTPLHCGMQDGASLQNIQALLEAFPGAAEEKNAAGETPLHTGLVNGASLSIIQVLLEAFPGATKKKDVDGQLPLHVGLRNDASLEVILGLLDAFPGAAKEKDADGRTPLYAGMQPDASVQIIQAVLKAFPGAAKEKDRDGCTPLHEALDCGASSEVIQTVLEAFPGATEEMDYDYQTPLHVGMKEGSTSIQSIQAILGAFPDAAKEKDVDGYLPLQRGLQNDASVQSIQAVLDHFPDAAKEKSGAGQTPLHLALWFGATWQIIQSLLDAFPGAAEEKNEKGRTPLHLALLKGASLQSVQALLEAYPGAAKEKDASGQIPLIYGLQSEAPLQSIEAIFKAFPDGAKERDKDGMSPLHISVLKGVSPDFVQDVFNYFPPAVHQEDFYGASPVSVVVNRVLVNNQAEEAIMVLRMFRKSLRDGRKLSRLCDRSNSDALQCFFSILSPDSCADAESKTVPPRLNLNEEPIPAWFMLEILADLETDEATEIFFQIVEQLRNDKRDRTNTTIVIKDDDSEEAARFVSTERVKKTTWREVADRAKVSNVPKLREWGETYGRFLGKYLLASNEEPKHRSATCVVVFGTELVEQANGQKKESKVALKFMANDLALRREVEKREAFTRDGISTANDYVVPIKAAFTAKAELDVAGVKFEKDFTSELAKYECIYLNASEDDTTTTEICHVLVMNCGSGLDLSDVLSHQDIARKNIDMSLHAGKSIAASLRFLNEECGLMHGDVKARNFVSLGVGAGYVAIDLDNAGVIASDYAGQKETSSGYLPPEQAAVLYFDRVEATRQVGSSALEIAQAEIDEVEKEKRSVMESTTLSLEEKLARIEQLVRSGELAQRKVEELKTAAQPEPVKASSQYDMWCFGLLLFRLCTNHEVFRCGGHEEVVSDNELKKIKEWTEDRLETQLSMVPKDGGWQNIVPLLRDLLQPDPSKRPNSWSSIIEALDGRLAESQVLRIQQTLARLEKGVNNIPDFIVQMESVCCPYLFQFITLEEFEDFRNSKEEDPSELDAMLGALDRAEACFSHASEILDDYMSGELKAKAKKHVLNKAWQKFSGHKKEVVYLQLLCGWTFKPVVSYKVDTDKYSEDFVKLAELGAKMCTVGIKVAVLWNAASGVARMFGYPVFNLPPGPIEKAKSFLESVNNASPVQDLKKRETEGFNLLELAEFKSFLDELDEQKRMRQMNDQFDKEELRSMTWSDAFAKESATVDGNKQVTWISKEESKRFK